MTTTITAASGGSTSPLLILGYGTGRPGRNIIHDLIGGGIAAVLIAPRPRAGTLELLYESEAEAFAALDLHCSETTFTLTSTDRPAVDMTYVIADGSEPRLDLDPETLRMWVHRVPYQEIDA
jgi:hypothetical protein